MPVSPPSHDRLNRATLPRAGIVFEALSSRRLYSIPRPYIHCPFTGCFNTLVSHTNSCPCLCSFFACAGFNTQKEDSKHKCRFQNTNAKHVLSGFCCFYRFQNTNTKSKAQMQVSIYRSKTCLKVCACLPYPDKNWVNKSKLDVRKTKSSQIYCAFMRDMVPKPPCFLLYSRHQTSYACWPSMPRWNRSIL